MTSAGPRAQKLGWGHVSHLCLRRCPRCRHSLRYRLRTLPIAHPNPRPRRHLLHHRTLRRLLRRARPRRHNLRPYLRTLPVTHLAHHRRLSHRLRCGLTHRCHRRTRCACSPAGSSRSWSGSWWQCCSPAPAPRAASASHCGGRSATSLDPASKEARRLKRKRRPGRARPRTRQLGGRRLMGPPSPTERRMPRVACRESAACPAARSPPTYRCSPRGRGWLCCCMRWRSPRVWRYSQPPEALRSHTRTTWRTLSPWVAMRTRGICTLTHWRGRAYTPKTATAVQQPAGASLLPHLGRAGCGSGHR